LSGPVEEVAVVDPIGWTGTAAPHRLVRAMALALTMTAAGVAAHVVAGGAGSPGLAAACAAALLGPAWLLTGRERSWTAIAGLQLAGQEAVHLLHGFAAGHGAGHALAAEVMLFSHVAVAAAIAAWLRIGERAAWRAARRAACAVAAWWRAIVRSFGTPMVVPPTGAPSLRVPSIRSRQELRHCVVRRGPPALA
jgi:hypothetical protein